MDAQKCVSSAWLQCHGAYRKWRGKPAHGETEREGFTQGLGFAGGSEDEGESSLQQKAGSTEVCSSPNVHTGGQRKKPV